MRNMRGARFWAGATEALQEVDNDVRGVRPLLSGGQSFSSHFLQRFLLIALFLAVDHHPDAVWIASLAVILNLASAYYLGNDTPRVQVSRRAMARQRLVPDSAIYPLSRTFDVIAETDRAEAHLVALGDKEVLWSHDGSAFLMYARQGNRLVSLFDPVGPQSAWRELREDFLALAKSVHCKPVFYQVSKRFASLCCDTSLRSYKLGECADIRVDTFTMQGKDWASLRRAINRAERDGLEFEYIEAGLAEPLLSELRDVSDAWLGLNKTSEKRFSLGAFDAAYVNRYPLAILRLKGRIIAFMNVLTAGNGAFVDLMRFIPGVHRGAMDLLVVRVIETLRERGIASLNLGMAPLSGLDGAEDASLWNSLGALVYRHGGQFYNFQGLRAFKEKFDPDWNARYMLVPAHQNPIIAAATTAVLIAGGVSRVFSR